MLLLLLLLLLVLVDVVVVACSSGDASSVAVCEKPLVMTIINDSHDQRLL